MYFAIWGVHLAYDGVVQTAVDQLSGSQQTVAAVYEHFFNGVNYSFVSDSLLPDRLHVRTRSLDVTSSVSDVT